MPRKLPEDISLDEAEEDVLFTIAAIKADPDSSDLAGETDDWMDFVDEARAADRAARQSIAETDALRAVANARLDAACTDFGDDLFKAAGKDRRSKRWTKFFSEAVARFVRQAFPKQVLRVKGWLESTGEPVLEKHRSLLTTWTDAGASALAKTAGTSVVRGNAWEKRREMADSLTRERDGLHETLAARARDRGLPRTWPDLFFRVERRRQGASEPEASEPAAAPSPPAADKPEGS